MHITYCEGLVNTPTDGSETTCIKSLPSILIKSTRLQLEGNTAEGEQRDRIRATAQDRRRLINLHAPYISAWPINSVP